MYLKKNIFFTVDVETLEETFQKVYVN